MTTTPGADERRIRQMLRTRGVGPDALTPKPAPAAIAPAGNWWERLYDDTKGDHAGAVPKRRRIPPIRRPAPEPQPEVESDDEDDVEPEWEDAAPDDESTPQAVRRSKTRPSRRVQAEFAGLERRMRWLLSTGASAGIGWVLGLEGLLSGWIVDCGHDNSPGVGVILGIGMVAAGSYANYRTRGWWPPLAWCCRIPAATALLALCIYAPGVTP